MKRQLAMFIALVLFVQSVVAAQAQPAAHYKLAVVTDRPEAL